MKPNLRKNESQNRSIFSKTPSVNFQHLTPHEKMWYILDMVEARDENIEKLEKENERLNYVITHLLKENEKLKEENKKFKEDNLLVVRFLTSYSL